MHGQPQRKRNGRTRPATAEELALRSAIATRQHAETRGYEIIPELKGEYRKAFRRLRKCGLTVGEAHATLKQQYGQVRS